MITCSLGDDGVPFYGDTCSFTCNAGYELTGSDTRTCQSDGRWSGVDTYCTNGINYLIQNSQAVKNECGPQKGYGEKRCEIQGGGQEMTVMVG